MELDNIRQMSDCFKEQVELQQEKHHEYRLIGKMKRRPGHIMFSYNYETGEIKPAKIDMCKAVDFATGQPVCHPKVVMEPNCVYRQALNAKNFIKILKRDYYAWLEKHKDNDDKV